MSSIESEESKERKEGGIIDVGGKIICQTVVGKQSGWRKGQG